MLDHTHHVSCPYCNGDKYEPWAIERGFTAVRCVTCSLIYVNPRPDLTSIESAVRTGLHGANAQYLNVRARRIDKKVGRYQRILERLFGDVWRRGAPISWLDVGAGYGEIVEAVERLAAPGSAVGGVEPMEAKASHARERGLKVQTSYLEEGHAKVDFVSVVDVFSHIPQFDDFLLTVKGALRPGGGLFIETGNLADIENREGFAGELGLPDHLVFAGETHLNGYLERAGFEILKVERVRIDGFIYFAKNVVKASLGRPVRVRAPYRSRFRQLLIRAKLKA